MTHLVEIKKEPILVSSTVLKYNQPDVIYLPITDYEIKVSQNAKVKIGSLILEKENKKILSPISGVVTGIRMMTNMEGKTSFLEITNDFQELRVNESFSKKNLNKMAKEKINEKLVEVFPEQYQEKQNFVLNCLDDEPYILTENFYLMYYCEEFLEFLDELASIYKYQKVILCVKSSSSENISKLNSVLGMYPNIILQICPDWYLLGSEQFLLEYLSLKGEDTTVIKAKDFRVAYNSLKRNKYTSTKFITISGDGVKNPAVIKVKIGTKLNDIIKEYFEVEPDSIYLANGLMRGKEISVMDFIITDEVEGIIITHQNERSINPCIHCGACTRICPYGLNPTLLRLKKYRNHVKDICSRCGLCSYICPSNIDFNEFWKGE